MRLGILTALWRRPALTAAVLDYYRTLNVPGVSLVRVAVKSPEDPEPVPGTVRCQWDGAWHYVSAPNAPLSDKWNAGMRALRPFGVDAVMIVGSDDLIHPSYIAGAVDAVRSGAHYVQAREALFVNLADLRSCRCTPSRMGGGRTLSAALLETMGWRPWPAGRGRALDGAMDAHLGPVDAVTIRPERLLECAPQLVAFKSAVNVWGYDALAPCVLREYDAEGTAEQVGRWLPGAEALVTAGEA